MDSILVTDLQDFFKNKSKYFVNRQEGHKGVPDHGEGEYGEYNKYFKFYKHPSFPANTFFRETWQTDSYGSGEAIISFDFVEGKEKTITVYEPI